MKRSVFIPALALLLTLSLAACSGGSPPTTSNTSAFFGGGGEKFDTVTESMGEAPDHVEQMMTAPDTGTAPLAAPMSPGSVYSRADAKLIRTADLSLETTEFEQAYATLTSLVEAQKGYFESAQNQGGGYYDKNAQRSGSYVIRVPRDAYNAFLSGAEGVGHVVSRSESSVDVGMEYFDTQAQLKTQETKRDRLQSLLEKAETMEDIIKLESALADVEYQIEQFSTTLRRYDGLVSYATINLSLAEVRKISDEPAQTDALSVRLAAAFSLGVERFGKGLENFALWAAYDFFGILIFAVLVALVVIFLVCRQKKHKLLMAARTPLGDIQVQETPAPDPETEQPETPPDSKNP